jgi:hypothetical protein
MLEHCVNRLPHVSNTIQTVAPRNGFNLMPMVRGNFYALLREYRLCSRTSLHYHLYSVVLEICVLVILLVSLVAIHFGQQDNVSLSTEGNILSYDNQ